MEDFSSKSLFPRTRDILPVITIAKNACNRIYTLLGIVAAFISVGTIHNHLRSASEIVGDGDGVDSCSGNIRHGTLLMTIAHWRCGASTPRQWAMVIRSVPCRMLP